MIQISTANENGQAVIRLAGDLTIYSATEARQELEALLAKQPSLALDLSEVDEIDTSGIQLLLWLKREAAFRRESLTLLRHSSVVVEAFDLLGVTSIFGDPILIGPS